MKKLFLISMLTFAIGIVSVTAYPGKGVTKSPTIEKISIEKADLVNADVLFLAASDCAVNSNIIFNLSSDLNTEKAELVAEASPYKNYHYPGGGRCDMLSNNRYNFKPVCKNSYAIIFPKPDKSPGLNCKVGKRYLTPLRC